MKMLMWGALSFLLGGCYYDHADEIYPTADCNPTTASYADVAEIMNRNSCNSCHNTSLASGNVQTDNYNSLKLAAQSGKLWGAVNHLPGYVAMPQGTGKISQCDLNRIKKWVDSGTPQ
ncbi:MAG: hypothetical protein ACO1OO_01360 [Flavisolibacter sp.]